MWYVLSTAAPFSMFNCGRKLTSLSTRPKTLTKKQIKVQLSPFSLVPEGLALPLIHVNSVQFVTYVGGDMWV